MSKRRRRSFVVAIATALLLAGLGAWAPAAAAPTGKANWSACFREFGPFQCATVSVPLDYDKPSGAKISVAMVRLPAANPALRQGSLFINPGGPGGSGVDFAIGAAPFLFTQDVRDRFDIVGFDPRGIIRSDPLRCFGTPRQWDPYFTPFAFPMTDEEIDVWIAADRYLDGACDRRGGAMLDHMSTANVARDMDRLRQAVGDEKLTYYGVSYGSMLGQTYANMFPDNFRALVIDGVLDPIAWTTGAPGQQDLPFSTRLRSDQGAQDTLDEFFRLCDAGDDACPLSGGSGSAARYADLADTLRAGPILIGDPSTGDAFEYTYSFLIADTLGAMYDSFTWPDFALFLGFLESQASPATLGGALAAFRGTSSLERSSNELSRAAGGYVTKRGFPRYPNFIEGFPAVACSDSDNPDSYQAWVDAGADADAAFGYFGRIWTWASSICAEWPGADADRYAGPFDAETGEPVLVVGAKWDPATRYEGALIAHDLLPNSALLTVDSWGHTSLFTSACADAAIATYLISGTTPAPGTVCTQDLVPWVDFGPSEPGP
jgi:pimeloyl-ACP methyl ester carboxylesterase